MPSKRKNTVSSTPRRIYTTRQIMEITEQRRLKEEAARKEAEPKPKAPENKPAPAAEDLKPPLLLSAPDNSKIVEEVKTFVSQVNIRPSQEMEEEFKEESKEVLEKPKVLSKDPLLINTIMVLSVFILSVMASVLIFSFKFPGSWVNIVAAKLNALVAYGSFFVFSIAQLPCTVEGVVLNMPYYRISLQGDLLAFYSLELLVVFAVLFAFVQKMSWLKRGVIFISLVPLAIVANIFRVLWACGLALNYGIAFADRYFYGGLVDFVFIFVVSGLIFFEFLFSPD